MVNRVIYWLPFGKQFRTVEVIRSSPATIRKQFLMESLSTSTVICPARFSLVMKMVVSSPYPGIREVELHSGQEVIKSPR